MSDSYSYTESRTFTVTHARHMAAKVATDLKRMQRFYGKPSDVSIAEYETEATEMLRAGYLDTVTYGFKKDGKWIEPTLRYTARDLAGMSANDDDPGRIRPNVDITGASFASYMTYTAAWDQLTQAKRDAFKATLPFVRNGAAEPGISGYLSNDRTYSSGGKALDRSIVRSF
jgi:hypothetical protein